jgi:hypothetical protein
LEKTILLEKVMSPLISQQLQDKKLKIAILQDNVTQFLYYATTMPKVVARRLANYSKIALFDCKISKLLVDYMSDTEYTIYCNPKKLGVDSVGCSFYRAMFADPLMTTRTMVKIITECFTIPEHCLTVEDINRILPLLKSRSEVWIELVKYLDCAGVLRILDAITYTADVALELLSHLSDNLLYQHISSRVKTTRCAPIDYKRFRTFAENHPAVETLLPQLLDQGNLFLATLLLQRYGTSPQRIINKSHLIDSALRQELRSALEAIITNS